MRHGVSVGLVVALLAIGGAAASQGQEAASPIVLQTSTALDGRGAAQSDISIVVRGDTIAEVSRAGTPSGRVYDLTAYTVLPGIVDTHVHIGWHFDADGRTHRAAVEERPEQSMLYGVENAYRTLMSGVTTVQSVGAPSDLDLRDAIGRGTLPGPRILTSSRSLGAGAGGPAAIRRGVEQRALAGADAIKLFASASIRDGGAPTMSRAQLDAACAEASRLGLRTVVHAHGPESARRAIEAGCTSIEHGSLLDRPTLELMAQRGTYFDPHTHLIFRNYFENKDRFLGIGNYTEEGFEQMERAVPTTLRVFREALSVPNLLVVFGTDAVAGAHGRNIEELIYRVNVGGQSPSAALVSATSLAAAALGLEDEIGALEPGMRADIIAVDGDPLVDITALRRVVFVMRDGRVYKYLPPGPSAGVSRP